MNTLCCVNNNKNGNKSQVNFAFYNKPITANFNGGDISSDGGLLLIKEFDKKIGYIDSISKCIEEYRIPNLIKHQIGQLISQRIYQIIAGYEDAVDCNLLTKFRHF